jgi:hypothetical protein
MALMEVRNTKRYVPTISGRKNLKVLILWLLLPRDVYPYGKPIQILE